MTANNGWRGKPGVPLNPAKDGWHWLKRISNGWETLAKWDNDWNGNGDFWWNLPGYSDPERVARIFCYLGPVLAFDEATALQKRVAELEGALKDAAASVGEWGAYASQYLQDKWELPGEVARYIAIAEGKNDAALTGGKDEA